MMISSAATIVNDASRRINMNFCCESDSLMMSITSGIVYSRGWPLIFGAMKVNVPEGLLLEITGKAVCSVSHSSTSAQRLSRNSKRTFFSLDAVAGAGAAGGDAGGCGAARAAVTLVQTTSAPIQRRIERELRPMVTMRGPCRYERSWVFP